MGVEETANEIIGLAYESALDPIRWPVFLERTAQAMNARSAMLRLVDYNAAKVGLFETVGYDPSFTAAYRNHFVRLDPYVEGLKRVALGSAVPSEMMIGLAERRKTEYHNDYERPQGKVYFAGCVLARDDSHNLHFAVQRGPRDIPFGEDAEALALLRTIVPHVARAGQVHRHLAEATEQKWLSLEALNHLRVGVILTDGRAKPFFINRAAEQLVSAIHGLRVVAQGLALPLPADTARLHKLIAEAGRIASGQGLAMQGCLRAALVGGAVLQILVVPLIPTQTRWGGLMPTSSVAVFISKPGRQRLPWGKVGAFYGLTRAEARLASKLAEGLSLEEAAKMLAITLHTARSQLKAVFAKTGVGRQSELVALLLSGVLAYQADDQLGERNE